MTPLRRALLPLAAVLLMAANDPPPLNPSDTIAERGTVRLTAGELRALVEHSAPALRAQAAANPASLAPQVRERVLQLGLAAEARAKGLDQRPDIQQRMNDAREAVLVQAYLAEITKLDPAFPSDADIATTYDANKSRFLLPKQYNLAQIAIVVPPGASRETEDEARKKAADLRAQALKPKADFADIARKHSQEKASAEKGGAIGFVREDQLVPGIKEVIPALADGAISEPLRTASGWHIIKLLGTKPPSPAALSDVREQIIEALRQGRQQQMARAYIDDMLKREPIRLNEIDLARALATPK